MRGFAFRSGKGALFSLVLLLAMAAPGAQAADTQAADTKTPEKPAAETPEGAPTAAILPLLDIKGPIGPATSDFLRRGLEKAREQGAPAFIIRMDTPGGLDTSMREIIKDILSSSIPIITYVAPSGARAASAGTYILLASHVAAMAPGTNLGAATPVAIGGGSPFPTPGGDKKPPWDSGKDKDDTKNKDGETAGRTEKDGETRQRPHPTMMDKVLNDSIAYIKSLAEVHGRNADWAEKAVAEAASLPAGEAHKAGAIDFLAHDIEDLLEKSDGRTVKVLGRPLTLKTAGASTQPIEPDWRTELLATITSPNIAYILLLIGVYGLIFEFLNPGAIVPGVIGAISLLIALFALHTLPINYAGLALILLGLAFMVAEAFVPTFGALGLGGIAAFVAGSILLLDTDVPGFGISWPVIAAVGGISSALFVLVIVYALKGRKRPIVSGQEQMLDSVGQVLAWDDGEGRIRIHGEVWHAVAPHPLQPGTRVRVDRIDGLTLSVRPDEQEGG
ncbi:MAG: nodulation protein NfeD [Rhodospirillales bacterium]